MEGGDNETAAKGGGNGSAADGGTVGWRRRRDIRSTAEGWLRGSAAAGEVSITVVAAG